METPLDRSVSVVFGTAGDYIRSLGNPRLRDALRAEARAARALAFEVGPWWGRSLMGQSWVHALHHHAQTRPTALALESPSAQLTFRELADRSASVATALVRMGVRRSEVVALLGPSDLSFVVLLLGLAHVGAVAALVPPGLRGAALRHALSASQARRAIASEDAMAALGEAGVALPGHRREALLGAAPPDAAPKIARTQGRDFVYIYTSGTTGLPKACRVSHVRALLAGASAGHALFELRPGDKVYCPLPLHHSSGLLLGVGAGLVTGTPVFLRAPLSVRAFWNDVQEHECTAMLYIGELCRYLVEAPQQPAERAHRLRIAVGNGLRPEVWQRFQARFDVETIREFYGATESPGALVNLGGPVGSVGRMPLPRSGWMRLARYDVAREALARDAAGRLVEAKEGEPGELLVRLGAATFRGYTDDAATKAKVLRNAFAPGDAYFRSGDLLRQDADGFLYFVDRIGDTFRWKGENVSTAEVEDALRSAAGVRGVAVLGVQVPGHEGAAGLAAIACDPDFDPSSLRDALRGLPKAAQPRFLRVVPKLEATATFKARKAALRAEGVNPSTLAAPVWVWSPEGYTPLTPAIWQAIREGRWRL